MGTGCLMKMRLERVTRELLRGCLLLLQSGGFFFFNSLGFGEIGLEEAGTLEVPFIEKELFNALFNFSRDKAPGLDGFPMAFCQFSWEFVKDEIMDFFLEFHEQGHFVRSLNANFVALIPLKGGFDDLKDFTPISLVWGLYKWVAKVFANRIKRVLPKVISKVQNAFVDGG